MTCKQLLLLVGDTYCSRLWCVWELCTLFSFTRPEQAAERVICLPLVPTKQASSSSPGPAQGPAASPSSLSPVGPLSETRRVVFDGADGSGSSGGRGSGGGDMGASPAGPVGRSISTNSLSSSPSEIKQAMEPLLKFDQSSAHCYDPNEEVSENKEHPPRQSPRSTRHLPPTTHRPTSNVQHSSPNKQA